MSIEAMKQWREALVCALSDDKPYIERCKQAITSIDQSIAEAEKQDKFCDDNCAWTDHHKDCVRASVSWKDMAFARLGVVRDKMHPDDVATVQRFLDGDYTHPQPKREWVGLTDEVKQEWIDAMPYDIEPRHCMILVNIMEAKLEELNT